MKTKNFKRPIALFLAVVLCAAMLFSMGTTAFAAGETEVVCLIAFPVTEMQTTAASGVMAI